MPGRTGRKASSAQWSLWSRICDCKQCREVRKNNRKKNPIPNKENLMKVCVHTHMHSHRSTHIHKYTHTLHCPIHKQRPAHQVLTIFSYPMFYQLCRSFQLCSMQIIKMLMKKQAQARTLLGDVCRAAI